MTVAIMYIHYQLYEKYKSLGAFHISNVTKVGYSPHIWTSFSGHSSYDYSFNQLQAATC